MRTRTAALAILLLCISIASTPLRSQTAVQTQSFQSASVKSSRSTAEGSISIERTGFEAENQSVKALISFAYDIPDFQVVGGPEWINTAGFDIDATGFPTTLQLLPQKWGQETYAVAVEQQRSIVRGMLRQLLADRFQLHIHNETRDLPIYELSIADSGSRMHPGFWRPPPLPDYPTLKPPPSTMPSPGATWNRFGVLAGSAVGMSNLVAMLSKQLKTPVVDKTSLSGLFTFRVMWTPDTIRNQRTTQGSGPVMVDGVPFDPNGPTLSTALQEQLGLKLTAAHGPVEVLVIDNVQKPTVNNYNNHD